jgi:hypothetical protein
MWQPNGMPLVGLVVTPLESTVGPMVAYNLVITLALALDGWACFVALRRWVGGFVGPLVGGAVFAFSPAMLSNSLGHAQMTCAALVPLAFLLLVDIVVEQRWRWWVAGGALGLLVAAQLLVGEELLADLGIAVVVVGVTGAAFFRHQIRTRVAHAARALGAAAVTATVLVSGPVLEQFLGPQSISGPLHSTSRSGTDLANLVLPVPALNEWTTSWSRAHAQAVIIPHGISETDGFVGATLLVGLVVVVVARWRRPAVRVTAVATAILVVLSLGERLRVEGRTFDIWLPWRLIHALPVLGTLEPNRLAILVDLGVAVLVAEGIVWIGESRTGPARALGAVAAAVCLAPLLPTLQYPTYTPAQPPFFTSTAVDAIPAGSTTLVVPFPLGTPGDDAGMIWQADAGLRFSMPGGGIFVPGDGGGNTEGGQPDAMSTALSLAIRGSPLPAQSPAVLAVERRDLTTWGVSTVAVGPMPHQRAALALLSLVLGTPPRAVDGVHLWIRGSGGGATVGSGRPAPGSCRVTGGGRQAPGARRW